MTRKLTEIVSDQDAIAVHDGVKFGDAILDKL